MDRYVTDIKNGCYQNPVLPMDFSDPDAIRVGEDYYLISSSFTYLPGVPLLHSRDLIHWEQLAWCVKKLPFARYDLPAHGCGTWAPTGMGRQSPVIVCIQNKADRDTLSKMNAAAMGGNGDPFYGAPCVAVVLVDKTIPTCVEDGSLVMGNMLNAAESVGLSACWIHRAKEMFETAEGQALLKKWGVPNAENLRGVGNCILGYAAEGGKKAPAPRKENYVVLVK